MAVFIIFEVSYLGGAQTAAAVPDYCNTKQPYTLCKAVFRNSNTFTPVTFCSLSHSPGTLPGDYDITHHAVETVVRKFVQKRRTHRFDGFAFSLGFHFLDNAKNLHMTSTGRFIVLY